MKKPPKQFETPAEGPSGAVPTNVGGGLLLRLVRAFGLLVVAVVAISGAMLPVTLYAWATPPENQESGALIALIVFGNVTGIAAMFGALRVGKVFCANDQSGGRADSDE